MRVPAAAFGSLPALLLAGGPRHAPCRASLSPGDNVVVTGAGAVCAVAAKLAALRGFEVKCLASEDDLSLARATIFDPANPEGSLPIEFLPLSGADKDPAALETAVAEAPGLIIAVDKDWTFTERQLETFIPEGTKLRHACLMSRNLNGEGMGVWTSAAKRGANGDVWEGGKESIETYRQAEAVLKTRAEAVGASWTIVRAGTLKGGGSGGSASGGGGEPSLLNPTYYDLNQGTRWALIYDCAALGVTVKAGDVLPGPGFTAALTATERVGAGDTHRGAVGAALVGALCAPAAENRDFGVASVEGETFPSPEQWEALLTSAAGGP